MLRDFRECEWANGARVESEAEFRTLADAIPHLCWMANADGWTFWYNRRWYEYTGGTPGEMQGWGWQIAHDPEILPAVLERWKTSLATGEPFDMVYPLRGGDGMFRPFLSRAVPMRGPTGNIVRWFGTNTDITDQRNTEEALRNERNFSEALVDSLPGVMYLFDAQGRFLRWNKNLERITGYSAGEISRMHPIEFFRGDDRRVIAERIGEVFTAGQSTAEAEFVFKDGGHRPYFFTGLRVTLPQGPCLVGMGIDISERKRAEQAIRESQQLLRAVIDNSTACVYVKDLQGRYFLINRRFEQLLHLTADTIQGKTDLDIFPREQAEAFRAADQRVLAAGTVLEFEELLHQDDAIHTYLSSKCPLYDEYGRPYAICGISTDITERKRVEEKVHQLNAELEQRVRDRTTQLRKANAAMHQLTGQLLRLQDDERRRIARELHDGTVQKLTAVAMNLLLIAQVPGVTGDQEGERLISEAQSLIRDSQRELRNLSYLLHSPDLEQLGLASALRSWVEGFGARSGITVDTELEDPGRLNPEIETAIFRIAQESLANVQRHSGSTTASMRLIADHAEIRLEVADEGRGIPIGVLDGNGTDSMKRVGVGILGMRERARQLGGSLTISSHGGGTTVQVVLPREVPR